MPAAPDAGDTRQPGAWTGGLRQFVQGSTA